MDRLWATLSALKLYGFFRLPRGLSRGQGPTQHSRSRDIYVASASLSLRKPTDNKRLIDTVFVDVAETFDALLIEDVVYILTIRICPVYLVKGCCVVA